MWFILEQDRVLDCRPNKEDAQVRAIELAEKETRPTVEIAGQDCYHCQTVATVCLPVGAESSHCLSCPTEQWVDLQQHTIGGRESVLLQRVGNPDERMQTRDQARDHPHCWCSQQTDALQHAG